MRTRRLKVTADNYITLKSIMERIPKHAKGNDEIREALNVSSGTWSYLRNSESYEEFVKMRSEADKPVEKAVENTNPSISIASDSYSFNRIAEATERIADKLDRIDRTLIRMCVAWESTPQKKGWLK